MDSLDEEIDDYLCMALETKVNFTPDENKISIPKTFFYYAGDIGKDSIDQWRMICHHLQGN